MSGETQIRAFTPRFEEHGWHSTHSVIEINGRDRPGLLHDVTKELTDLGLQISSALITTYGERAVDVFYVKDAFGMQVTHDSKLKTIHDRVLAALGNGAASENIGSAAE